MAPSGRHMQYKGENLELLLLTHFPNLMITEEVAASATACSTKHLEWRVGARVVTYSRMEWAIDSFAPYKSPGTDGIFLTQPCCKSEEGLLSLTWSRSFVPAWWMATFQPYSAR